MTRIENFDYLSAMSNTGATTAATVEAIGKDVKSFKEELQVILAEKRATVRETLEEMKEQRELLNAVKSERETNETLTRLMPDGSIMITEVQGGKIVSTDKYKPHMQAVLDTTKPIPETPEGAKMMSAAETKLEPFTSIFELIA